MTSSRSPILTSAPLSCHYTRVLSMSPGQGGLLLLLYHGEHQPGQDMRGAPEELDNLYRDLLNDNWHTGQVSSIRITVQSQCHVAELIHGSWNPCPFSVNEFAV